MFSFQSTKQSKTTLSDLPYFLVFFYRKLFYVVSVPIKDEQSQ